MYNSKSYRAARKNGYRSGLEETVNDSLRKRGVKNTKYESMKIEWEDLAYRTYTPDFILPNNIIIETKGLFTPADRRKHLKISQQHPELDIRFVFTNAKRKLNKGAKGSYGSWCDSKGFKYSTKDVPDEWIKEPKHKGATLPEFIDYKGTKHV